jgi:hypothetical protein
MPTGQIETAQAKADAARTRATELARQGGWAYKSGAFDRANAEAARYQAEADAAHAASLQAERPLVSPELAAAQERLNELRQAGGWAYKSGAVARAEADVRALTESPAVTMGFNETVPPPRNWGKPVEKTMRTYR